MRSVDADVDQRICIQNIQLNLLGEGVFLAVLLNNGSDGDGGDLRLGGSPVEGNVLRAACRDGVPGCVSADDLVADGVGQGLDGCTRCFAVEQRGGEGELFVRDGGSGAADEVGDAQLQGFADPDRSGHGQIAVALGNADEVVAVVGIKRAGEVAGGKVCGIVPGVDGLAGVDDDFHLGDAVGPIRVIDGNSDVQLLGNLGNDAAQHLTVDGVVDFQVLILGGVDAAGADGIVEPLLREIIGEDDVTGGVCIAPLALVVVLVVGRSDVPALIQRNDVLLIAGIVAACADLTLAVADFDQIHTGVDYGIPVGKVGEGAEGGAGMVELADGVDALFLAQQGVIGLHAGVRGLVVQCGVVAGNDAGSIEGVDMAGAAGPCHFEAAQRDHGAGVLFVERSDGVLVGLPAVVCIGILDQGGVIQCTLDVRIVLGIKVVGMVGEGNELDVVLLADILDVLQSAVQRAGAVGILRVGMELAEVELILCLADGEAPGLGGGLAVRAGHSQGDDLAAVFHVRGGLVGDLAVCVGGVDFLSVNRHLNSGVLACVDHVSGDFRTLVVQRLRALLRGDVINDGLVLDGDLVGGLCLVALGILEGKGQGHVVALGSGLCDERVEHGDVNLALAGNKTVQNLDIGVALQLADAGNVGTVSALDAVFRPRVVDRINRVDVELKLIVLADIGVEHDFREGDGRLDDQTAVNIHTLCNRIEEEGIEGVIQLAILIVHAVGLVAVVVVFQPLAMAAELCRAAFHFKAAHAAGAGTNQPVGVVRGNALFGEVLGVEGVAAGAVGAEIAVGFALEAVVVAVSFHGEDDCAVAGDGLFIFNRGCDVFNALAVVFGSQNALGILVVDDELVAGLRQIAGGGGSRRIIVCNEIELLREERFVIADRAVAAPVVLIGEPFKVAAAGLILDVNAVRSLGIQNFPGSVCLVQRGAGELSIHGELFALRGGESVGAVCIDADCPDIGLGIAGEFAIRQSNVGALVIETGILGGQGFQVGRVEHNDLVAVGEPGDDAALADLIESLCKERFIITDRAVAAPVVLIGEPFKVAAASLVFDVVAAVRFGGADFPGGVCLVQRGAGVLSIHGELFAL